MDVPALVTVALIEDNRLLREGIAALLAQLPDLRVVATAARADTALLRRTHPQVILLDLGLRNGDSLAAIQIVRRESPDSRVIVMDLLPVHEELAELINAGVSGFVMKDATLEDLVRTIRLVAEGGHVLPSPMVSTLFSQIASEAVARGRAPELAAVRMTPRERQVVNLIAEGLSNKDIASRLHIATHTVKSHVRNVMEKLALHTRLQIAVYAHRGEAPPAEAKA